MPNVKVNDINMNYKMYDESDGFPVILINGLGGDMNTWAFEPSLLNAIKANHKTIIF